jgi:hypothetical protein
VDAPAIAGDQVAAKFNLGQLLTVGRNSLRDPQQRWQLPVLSWNSAD